MQDYLTPPRGGFDPTANVDDTLAAVVEHADDGWQAHDVEDALLDAGFDPAVAAELIDAAWGVA